MSEARVAQSLPVASSGCSDGLLGPQCGLPVLDSFKEWLPPVGVVDVELDGFGEGVIEAPGGACPSKVANFVAVDGVAASWPSRSST